MSEGYQVGKTRQAIVGCEDGEKGPQAWKCGQSLEVRKGKEINTFSTRAFRNNTALLAP